MQRRIWRITPSAPRGEIVVLDSAPDEDGLAEVDGIARLAEASDTRVLREPNWQASSYDLLHGLEVTEFEDTVPGKYHD
ncbi:MAG: hypothetical protein ABI809_13030 [Caldimonas sp.]